LLLKRSILVGNETDNTRHLG